MTANDANRNSPASFARASVVESQLGALAGTLTGVVSR